MRLTAVIGMWLDRPPEEALHTASLADRLGYDELWIGEMASWDAFALATAAGLATDRIAMTLGPFAVAVRTPMTIAMGAASVGALTGREIGVAIGTSSAIVVEHWHGRSRSRSAAVLEESARALRPLLAGERAEGGYRLRLDPPRGPFTIAAFGDRAVETAAAYADRMVINLVSPEQAGSLRGRLEEAAARHGRPAPRLAAWVPAAVDPEPEALAQLIRGLVPYLAAPGYGEMFTQAGYGEVVELARKGVTPKELLTALPIDITGTVGLVGSAASVKARLAAYAEAGVDEVAIVPATGGDPGGERTLAALR